MEDLENQISDNESLEKAKENIVSWVSENSPSNLDYTKARFQEISIEEGDGNSFAYETKVLSLQKDSTIPTVTHELVHALSSKYLRDHFIRSGLISGSTGGLENEAFTELSVFVITKGSDYFVNNDVESLVKEYSSENQATEDYSIATSTLIRELKNSNLNKESINKIIETYLFDDGTKPEVQSKIEMIMGRSDLYEFIKEQTNEFGYKITEDAWDGFVKGLPDISVPLNGSSIPILELIEPLNRLIRERKIPLVWFTDHNLNAFIKNMAQLTGSKSLNINPVVIGAVSRMEDQREKQKVLRYIFISLAVEIYKQRNN